MSRNLRRFSLLIFLLSWLLPVIAFPQASVNVSTLDPVYRDIDKLVGEGLVDKIIIGQRPFSRREIARITAEAMSHLSRLKDPLSDPTVPEKKKEKLQRRLEYVEGILVRLQQDYREELVQLGALEGEKSWYSAHPIEKVIVDTTITNSPPEALAIDNGLGGINAVINPLVDYRQGRHIVDGGNLSLETTHWFRVTKYMAFFAQPRFQLAIGRENQPDDNNVYIQNLYGKIWVKNFEIEVGRDNLVYGQGLDAGLLLSNNPRGLDMAKISNDSPFFFPWVFKYMGANKFSFFYADLGPEQNFPNAYLTGFKWSLQPISFIELGASLLVQSGGQGSPSGSFGARVATLFGFNPEPAGMDLSNKIGGFDARFRIPPLRRTELYLEAMFDDRHQSVFSHAQLVDDASYVAGFYLPRLNDSGTGDLRFEYHKTGDRFYRHNTWNSGWTENRFILGDNLGPDAWGLYLSGNWDLNKQNMINWQLAYESRSRDIWAVDDPFQFSFKKIQDFPDEQRWRGVGGWLYRMQDLPMQLWVSLGYERVQNFNFASGNGRNNFLGQMTVQVNLDRWAHFPR